MKRNSLFNLLMALGLVLALGVGISMARRAVAQEPGPEGPLGPQAAVGTAFTYQGRLIQNSNPISDTCDFQFTLYGSSGGADQIGAAQAKPNVPVSDGYFTVDDLDFGSGVFTGEARWLAIAVDCGSGSTNLTPRVALDATPYALYALGAPWSGLTNRPAGLDDGDDNTTYTAGTGLDLTGGEFSITTAYRLPQSCANGQIAEWNGSAWTCGDDDTGSGGYWSLTGNAGTTPGANFLGTTDDQALELYVNNARALRIEPTTGVPNLIGGYSGNSVGAGVEGATIGGGGYQWAANYVSGNHGTVSGGSYNTASGEGTTVGGGNVNRSNGTYGTVGGGQNNLAGSYAVIGGGMYNTASGTAATIGGGEFISVTGQAATVGGGSHITVTGDYATVGGGWLNTASNEYATIGGGYLHTASGDFATVGGGWGNIASDYNATVGGGYDNEASSAHATVGGGYNNKASGDFATVFGGHSAEASHFGEVAHASGSFSEAGDAQGSFYVLRGTTYDDTPAELFLAGGSQRLTVADDRVVTFDILVVARDEFGNPAGYSVQGVIENWVGNTAFVGIPMVTTLGEFIPAWDVTVVADDANDALVIEVTGAAAETTRWVATVRTAEVSW
jgi:hypothetical protein